MVYILIVMWLGSGKAAIAVEFNDLKSCKAAATEVQRQDRYGDAGTIICAAKGKP